MKFYDTEVNTGDRVTLTPVTTTITGTVMETDERDGSIRVKTAGVLTWYFPDEYHVFRLVTPDFVAGDLVMHKTGGSIFRLYEDGYRRVDATTTYPKYEAPVATDFTKDRYVLIGRALEETDEV